MQSMRSILVLMTVTLSACQGVSKLDLARLGRASWQRPDDVVKALELEPGSRVADLGSGEGYFVPYLVEAVGLSGRVYAVDVEPQVTQGLEERFASNGDSVEVVLGRPDDPELPDGTIDLVLIVNTYHHIDDRPTYFGKLRADLSAGGRVAIIDPDADLGGMLSLTLDEGHKSSAEDISREMRAAGYRRTESFDFLPVQVFEVFAPAVEDG